MTIIFIKLELYYSKDKTDFLLFLTHFFHTSNVPIYLGIYFKYMLVLVGK